MTVYTYGANGLVSKQKGNDVSYYHSDNLGSSSLVTDSSGDVTYSTDYYPFGSSLHEDGEEKYTYNSKELDSTGLYYYGARYYDANIGRFISVDPVSGNIYNPQRLNRYSYTLNNPLKYVDPTGTTQFRLAPLSNPDSEFLKSAVGSLSSKLGSSDLAASFSQLVGEGRVLRKLGATGADYAPSYDSIFLSKGSGVDEAMHELVHRRNHHFGIRGVSRLSSKWGIMDEKLAYSMSFDAKLALGKTDFSVLEVVASQGTYGQFSKLLTSDPGYPDLPYSFSHRLKSWAGAGFRRVMNAPGVKKFGKYVPVLGACANVGCAVESASGGEPVRAGFELAGAIFEPADWALLGYDAYKAPPRNQPQFVTPMARPMEKHLRNPGEGNL